MFVISPVTLMSIKDFVMWKAFLHTWPMALINHLSCRKKKLPTKCNVSVVSAVLFLELQQLQC